MDAMRQLTQPTEDFALIWLDLHARLAASYTVALAREMGLPLAEVERAGLAGLLHDVGKLLLPEELLTKPGPLTHDEYQSIQRHVAKGCAIIARLPWAHRAMALVSDHHEQYDGKGYPLGLAGEQIPIGARVLAVADTFAALITPRPYRPPFSQHMALSLLEKDSGQKFDPAIIKHFIAHIGTISSQAEENLDSPLLPYRAFWLNINHAAADRWLTWLKKAS